MSSRNRLLGILVCILYIFTSSCMIDDEEIYINIPGEKLENNILHIYTSKEALMLPLENELSAIPSDPNNPLTKDKVLLGKFLFHETGFGSESKLEIGKNTYSCASCHHVKAGFQSGLIQGIGDGGVGFGIKGEARVMNVEYTEDMLDVQPIRSPSVLNVAYQKVMLWNGQFGSSDVNSGTDAMWTVGTPKETNHLGFEGVETQAIAGLKVHRQSIQSDLIINSIYKDLFDAAFPEVSESERYSLITAGLAIAAYERTLLPAKAPFQQWLRGNEQAMSDDQKEGAALFFGEAKCYTCHSGPGLNGKGFYALGMKDLEGIGVHGSVDEATKKGRGGFTGNSQDDYKFKTPQLYNLKDVSFLGHGGSFRSIREVVAYKNEGQSQNNHLVPTDKLSKEFEPLDLTEEQLEQISLFIEIALYDDSLERFVPEGLLSGNCFPNADVQSRLDMGCQE